MNILKKWYYKTRDSSRLLQTVLCPFTVLSVFKDLEEFYNKKDSFIGRTMFLVDHETKTFSEDYIFIRVEKKEVTKDYNRAIQAISSPHFLYVGVYEYKFIFMDGKGTLISRLCCSVNSAREIGNAFTIMWID